MASAAPMERYVYIDGGYLRQRLDFYSKRYFDGQTIDLDYDRLLHEYQKRFYYDCLPPKRNGEEPGAFAAREEGMRDFFDHLRELRGFHVYEGKLSGGGEKARQKGVDIQLAVHMLSHVSRGIVRRVTLIAGDADFEPLAEALVAEGAFLTLWADRRSVAKRLRHAADQYTPLDLNYFFNAVTPEFKTANPLPQLSSSPDRNHEGLPLVRSGTLRDGSLAEIFANKTRAIIVYPVSTSQHMHISWDSPERVANMAEDLGALIAWRDT